MPPSHPRLQQPWAARWHGKQSPHKQACLPFLLGLFALPTCTPACHTTPSLASAAGVLTAGTVTALLAPVKAELVGGQFATLVEAANFTRVRSWVH